jgi:hypothetical protein
MSRCPRNEDRIRRLFGDAPDGGKQPVQFESAVSRGSQGGRGYSCVPGSIGGAAAAAAAASSSSSRTSFTTKPLGEGEGGIRNRSAHATTQWAASGAAPSDTTIRSATPGRFNFTPEQLAVLDLNIDNYTVHDLLRLYNLPATFDIDNLKNAYRQTIMTHPDKSGYPKEVFLFFSKAFRTIKSIYEFRTKKEMTMDSLLDERENMARETSHSRITGLSNKKQSEVIKTLQSRPDFNEWFNETFEKAKLKNEFADTGYDEWFREGGTSRASSTTYSADDISADYDGVGGSKDRMHEVFERRRREARAIIVYNTVSEAGLGAFGSSVSASSIDGSRPDDYSSDMFSNLQYEDLHKAHTQTVVPVSEEEDYHSRPKFSNVDEYKRYQASLMTRPPTKEEAERELMRQYQDDIQESNTRAMRLIQQEKEAVERMKAVWGSALRLTGN